jgi:hypothetical protein
MIMKIPLNFDLSAIVPGLQHTVVLGQLDDLPEGQALVLLQIRQLINNFVAPASSSVTCHILYKCWRTMKPIPICIFRNPVRT